MERTLAVALVAVAVLAVAVPGPTAVASRSPAVDGATAQGATHPPGAASTATPVAMQNTTAKLLLPGGGRPGAGVAGADLGAAVAVERRTTVAQLGAADVERRFEAASNDEERRAVIERALDRIGNRTLELRTIETRAYREYADGNRTMRSLLLALARVDTEARQYRERIRRLADLSVQVSGISLRTSFGSQLLDRARSIDTRLETLTGPVRRHVAEAYRGSTDGGLVYVAAADQGVVLAAVVGDTYVREALRADRFERGPGHPINLQDLVAEAYPWTWDNQVVNRDFEGTIEDIGVWRIRLGHTQGRLRAYVDRDTESVFREVQRLQPERLPNRTTTAEADGLAVTVNRTFPGGPLEVTVVDNVTGRPVGSVVTVEGHYLGRTGPDGELWTVAPRGPVAVTVTQGPNSVTVSVPESEFRTTG